MLPGRDRGGCDSSGSSPQQIAVETAATVGELHAAAATEHGLALLIAISAGIASMQRRNDQHADANSGRYVPLLEPALDMFADYFCPDKPPEWVP